MPLHFDSAFRVFGGLPGVFDVTDWHELMAHKGVTMAAYESFPTRLERNVQWVFE